MNKQIWTIGHSTKPLEEFVELLQLNDIKLLADVRRFPGSRKYPHFSREALQEQLPTHGIQYLHFEALGGRRRAVEGSKNTVWRHPAFKGYADYMATEDFQEGIKALCTAAAENPTAMMCSEVLWWRCHRSLISDLLKSQEYRVLHILSSLKVQEYPYTSAARVVGGKLSYEAEE